jgi:ATP-dependent protease ClpP protease subunit
MKEQNMKRSTRLALFVLATFTAVAVAAWGRPAHAVAKEPRSIPAVAEVCRPDEVPCVVTIAVTGVINELVAEQVSFYFQLAEFADADAVLLKLDSPGGEVAAGAKLRNTILRSKLPVHCLATGLVASTAFWVYESCPSPNRYVTPGTKFVTHRAYLSVPGGGSMQVEDLLLAASELMKLNQLMAKDLGPRLGMTPAQWLTKVTQGDWEIRTPEALHRHASDAVFADPGAALAFVASLYLLPQPNVR